MYKNARSSGHIPAGKRLIRTWFAKHTASPEPVRIIHAIPSKERLKRDRNRLRFLKKTLKSKDLDRSDRFEIKSEIWRLEARLERQLETAARPRRSRKRDKKRPADDWPVHIPFKLGTAVLVKKEELERREREKENRGMKSTRPDKSAGNKAKKKSIQRKARRP
jgi:hypothetical protein